jgi:hypothetical protein
VSAADIDERLRARVEAAVKHYWKTRSRQAKKQGAARGSKDAGLRTAVTGGAQLDGFINLIRDLLIESGLERAHVFLGRKETVLPGFYRPTKAWDIVAVADKRLVACVEIKSHAGPSYGNNFNNRVEEALGNAIDFWKAYEQGGFASLDRPFLGYIMLLEDDERSNAPVAVEEPHFAVREEFRNASYAQRYQLLCEKLLRERLYDSAAFLMSARDAAKSGEYRERSADLAFKVFAANLMARGYALARAK